VYLRNRQVLVSDDLLERRVLLIGTAGPEGWLAAARSGHDEETVRATDLPGLVLWMERDLDQRTALEPQLEPAVEPDGSPLHSLAQEIQGWRQSAHRRPRINGLSASF